MSYFLWKAAQQKQRDTKQQSNADIGPSSNPRGKAIGSTAAILGLDASKLNHDLFKPSSESEDPCRTRTMSDGTNKSNEKDQNRDLLLNAAQSEVNILSSEQRSDTELGNDTFEIMRIKSIMVIQSLIEADLNLEGLVTQVRAKIDQDAPEEYKTKIALKILKTRLRKWRRKEKDHEKGPSCSLMFKGKNNGSSRLKQFPEEIDPYSSSSILKSQASHKQAVDLLQRMISVEDPITSIQKPGDALLSLISPNPRGIYWLNNSKLPEIKSLWRKRLQRAQEVQMPINWPREVPDNYRINVGKKPLRLRRQVLLNLDNGIPVGNSNNLLLLADSYQSTVTITGHSLQAARGHRVPSGLTYSNLYYYN